MKENLQKTHTGANRIPPVIRLIICALIFVPIGAGSLNAQSPPVVSDPVIVTGVILDENDKPLPAATIILALPGQTQTISLMSDDAGRFRLAIPLRDIGKARVLVSYLGYRTRTLLAKDAQTIILEPDPQKIADVVVTGIFRRQQGEYTGSAVTITREELFRVGNRDLFQSLKNLEPSLNIFDNWTTGSDPNALPEIQLRGTGSFPTDEQSQFKGSFVGNASAPLFVLDGFVTTLDYVLNMDMNRIETVTILKDASAKAIYGSKAANGVIVIETRRLLSNQTRVTYTGNVSVEVPDLRSYDLTNALEKLEVEKLNGLYESASTEMGLIMQQIYQERMNVALSGASTYWLSKPLQTGVSTRHNLDVELGEKDLKTLANFSYNKRNGVMKDSGNETISGMVTFSYRKGHFQFRNQMTIRGYKEYNSPYGNFATYAAMNPYFLPYDENGTLKRMLYTGHESLSSASVFKAVGNPLYDARLDMINKASNIHMQNNFYVDFTLCDFRAVLNFGITSMRGDKDVMVPAEHSMFNTYAYNTDEAKLRRGTYEYRSNRSSSLTGRLDLQYNKAFDRHSLFANVSFDVSEQRESQSTFNAEGLTGRMQSIGQARMYAQGMTPVTWDYLNRNISLLEFVSYDYDNRYVVDLTFRSTASSVVGDQNPWTHFWSAGAAWNLHNERFMAGIDDLRRLRFRISYGLSGNQATVQNQTYSIYRYDQTMQYQDFYGLSLTNLANPNLKMERSHDFNVGFDLLWKALSLRAEYYRSRRENAVTNMSIVPSTGFTTVRANLGEILNSGFEGYVGYTVWSGHDGFLNLHAGVKTNKNVISKVSDEVRRFNEAQMEKASYEGQYMPVLQFVDGMPVNAIWAVPSLGIDPMTGNEIFLDQQGNITSVWDARNLVSYGTSDPKYNGNFGFSGEYKGFGVSATATFLGGGMAYNYTLVSKVESADIAKNVDRRILTGRWREPGQNTQFASISGTVVNPETGEQESRVTRATSRFVQRRNELTISQVSAYYEFGGRFIERFLCKRLRLSFYMNDIATFSTIKIERGTAYPFSRSFSFELTATF